MLDGLEVCCHGTTCLFHKLNILGVHTCGNTSLFDKLNDSVGQGPCNILVVIILLKLQLVIELIINGQSVKFLLYSFT